MQSQNENAVKVLNSLIETTLDSANGYREAAECVEDAQLKTMFSKRAEDRRQLSHRLQEEVRSFGGEAREDQSFVGKLHNKFTQLRSKAPGDGDAMVIEEVERGEDVIKAKFKQAVDDRDLPAGARDLVSSAYSSIKSDHDTISRMKHDLH